MYVCICHAVTDKQIREAVREGARDMRDISHQLGVSTGCGKCGMTARQIVRDALSEEVAVAVARGDDAMAASA